MWSHRSPLRTATAMALALAATACAADSATDEELVPATVSLAAETSPALVAAATGMVADLVNGPVTPAMMDSLMVTVVRVDVLPDSLIHRCHPPLGDSARGYRPQRRHGGGNGGPMGPPSGCVPRRPPHHPRPDSLWRDSLVRPDTGWGSRPDHWYSLTPVGSGRLDLLHLPTDSGAGLLLASGSVPPGDYGAAHILVTDATVWFNTTITTGGGTVFQPNTAYPVILPGRAGRRGIMTGAGFTVPDGGGDVELTFNAATTVGRAIATDSGTVILAPVLRPRRH